MSRTRLTGPLLPLVASLMLALLFIPAGSAHAATIAVTTTDDEANADGDCSLREAINSAQGAAPADACTPGTNPGADSITLPAGTYTLTTSAQLPQVTSTITINGAGAATTIIQAAVAANTATWRVFEVATTGNLTLNRLTVRHGRCNGSCATTANSGGGIYNAGTLVLDASTVSANTATSSGGGIYNTGTSSTVTIQNGSTVGGAGAGNTAGSGGGIFNNSAGQVTIDASTVSANTAIAGGGIINGDASTTLIIQNGSVIGGAGAANSALLGGGIYNINGTLTIDASTVSANTATSTGGGIYNTGVNSGVTIQNGSTIGGAGAANTATNNGGGIYNEAAGQMTIDASTVSANTASNGGGIYNFSATVTIRNGSTIGGAGAGNTGAQFGGGISNTGTVQITGSTISHNTATNSGGGLYNSAGTVNINASRISSNTATSFFGGGIYNLNAGSVNISNGSVIGGPGTGNRAVASNGGGITTQSIGSIVVIDASTVSGNTAGISGGGITVESSSTLTIQNGSVIGGAGAGNSAANSGGGIWNLGGTATISNSTISSNTATNDGDALLHLGGTSSASNSCIIGNGVTAVSNLAVTAQNFANNWWGAASGPGPVGPGSGDTISLDVNFAPFLTSDAGTPCGLPLPPVVVEPVPAGPACPALDLEGTGPGSITPGGRASVTFTVKNPNSAGSCASDVLNISVPGGLNVASITTTQGQITSQIPPTLSVNLGSISPGAEVVVTVTLSLPQSAAIHGLARPIAQSQYCLTGSTTGDTATVCLSVGAATPAFPTTLPNTGGQPVTPWQQWWPWVIAGIAAAGLALGGWRLLTAPRRS